MFNELIDALIHCVELKSSGLEPAFSEQTLSKGSSKFVLG